MRSLLVSVVAVGVLAGCRGGESDQPPVRIFQNMATQEKGRPYRAEKNGIWEDGRFMRTPVEGTVAVGQLFEDDLLHEGTSEDGGVSMLFPDKFKADGKVTDATVERGSARYAIYCVPCHGVAGDGKGIVAGRGMSIPPANLVDARIKDLPAGKIYAAIRHGVNNGNMASYAAQIPVDDRWAIVAYVRKLQGVGFEGGSAPMAIGVDPKEASAEFGAIVYKAKICNSCHTLDGTRLVGPSWKGVYGIKEKTSAGEVTVDDAYLEESMVTPNAKVVEGYPPAMPPQQLTKIQIQSLILFIKAQK